MTRKQLVESLQIIERKYEVHTWTVANIHVWPLIKIQTFFSWFHTEGGGGRRQETSGGSSVGSYLRSVVGWLVFLLTPKRDVRWLFTGAAAHRVLYEGRFFNRYFDPMMDYLKKSGETVMFLEQSQLRTDSSYYERQRIWYIGHLYPLARWIAKLFYPRNGLDQVEIRKVFEELEATIPGIDATKLRKKVEVRLIAIEAWIRIFDQVFEKIKPDNVFGLCYYSNMMLGMNVSAHRRGIRSIDMQHGSQGPLHVAYGDFSKVPDGGYELLPQMFWCWDENSARQIKSWTSRQDFHRVIQGGNPWTSLWAGETRTKQQTILLSLQPIEPLVPEYLPRVIENTRGKYKWVFRLHPRQTKDLAKVRELVESASLSDVVLITDAYSVPLPRALGECFVHISRFSGTIIEACMQGVPSIVIDEVGVEAFRTEIAQNLVYPFLGSDVDEFADLLHRLANCTIRPAFTSFESALDQEFD